MKRNLVFFLALLMLLCGAALAEESRTEAVIPADQAQAVAVAQDVTSDGAIETCYEVTAPIHLPVTVRIQQADGTFDEITITPAVAQITYYMETTFIDEKLCGGLVDVLHYPKLSWLGVPPYPGGPYLPQDVLPREILYKAAFSRAEMPHGGGFGTQDGGQSATVRLGGGSFDLTYVSVITLDNTGVIIDTAVSTERIPYDFDYTFRADAPEYTGELTLPTFEEWMGVASIPR